MRGARRKPIARASMRAGSRRATRISARRPGLRVARQRAQARRGRARRFSPAQRHAVGDRRERDEVEVLVGARRVALRRASSACASLCATPARAEVGARVAAERRVDDRRVGQRAVGARAVVVGDDDVHAQPRAPRATSSTAVIAQSTVIEQPRAARGEPLDRRALQAVAVLGAARGGTSRRRRRARAARARGSPSSDAVDVVVAVDRDPRAGARRGEDERRRPRRCPRTPRGRGAPRPPGSARRVGLAEAAAHEHLRERRALTPSSRSSAASRRDGRARRRSRGGRSHAGEATAARGRNRRAAPAARTELRLLGAARRGSASRVRGACPRGRRAPGRSARRGSPRARSATSIVVRPGIARAR